MKHKVRVSLCACLLVASGILFGNACSTSAQVPTRSPGASAKLSPYGTKLRVVESFIQSPLSFEANHGQTDPGVKFLARGQGYTLFLTRRAEVILSLAKQPTTKADAPNREAEVIRMSLAGAAINPAAEGMNELPGKANYFIGNDPKNWRTNVPVFAKAKYCGVYPGVDLVYYGNQGQLEYDFIVAAGADPRSVTLNFAGVKKLSIDVQGALVLRMKEGDLRVAKPLLYQEINGERREISGGYALKNAHEVGFQIPTYDPTKSLIIDPTLSYSTYLGGTGLDNANSLAVDATGNAYVTGWTSSVDFPVTPGAFQTAAPPSGRGTYAFVTKLNAAGSGLVYSTYLGGNQEDVAYGIRVDAAGNAYVTGYTSSTNFPVTPGAFQEVKKVPGVDSDAFVTKLSADGSALVYSTYLGGSSREIGQAIALDTAGNAYVAGWTFSTDFPTTLSAFQPINRASVNATTNAFVTELNAQGTALLYSTYLGGSGGPGNGPEGDTASSIAVDAQGNAYVTGRTCSSDFPTTPLAFQVLFQGSRSSATAVCSGNAFMSKLNPALPGPASLVYSTYLGGSGGVDFGVAPEGDAAYGIAVDAQQNAYVTGQTCSANFPVTPLAFQPVYGGVCDAFVTKLNPSGPSLAGLVYSTFLGGSSIERGAGIDLDSADNAYIAGYTSSTNFPTTPDAFQTTLAGNSLNAFVTVLNPSGSAPLVYSTYLGGSTPNFFSSSNGRSIAVDMAGQAYLTGYTYAADFPTTPGAFQTWSPNVNSNVYHSFVAKFSGFPTQ